LEAQEVAKVSTNGVVYDFWEQAHESGACLPTSLGLYEDLVKHMGVYTRQERNPCSNTYNPIWAGHPNFSWRGNNSLN